MPITRAAILAGGLGTRMQELTEVVPKPMVEIGGLPILWHIMKIYSHYGVDEFFIALGYKGHIIKDFFLNYSRRVNSVRVQLREGSYTELTNLHEDWQVNLIETGAKAETGARISGMADYIGQNPFFLTYGDGVADINIRTLEETHYAHGKLGTVTAVQPPSKFGKLGVSGSDVHAFAEKTAVGETLISGGFFAFEPEIFDYVSSDPSCIFEREPLEKISSENQLTAYRHDGFWHCMDTVRDVTRLNEMWEAGEAPWNIWG